MSTYMGGDGGDVLTGLTLRRDGSLIAVGFSTNGSFPLKDPLQSDASPYLGYPNPVLAILSTSSNSVSYATYFGNKAAASPMSVTADSAGHIYVVGQVHSPRYPIQSPLFSELSEGEGNGFLTQFSPNGKQIEFSTYLPGSWPKSVALDSSGNIYVGGNGYPSFPTKDSLQAFRGGGSDHFVMKIASGGRVLAYATLIGGSGNEVPIQLAVKGDSTVYFARQTRSVDYPVKSAYQPQSGGSTDGILGRIADSAMPEVTLFSATPTNLVFRFVRNGTVPAAAIVAVDNLTQGVTVYTPQTWLRVSPATLESSGKLQVSIDPAGLDPGSYQGTVQLIPATGARGVVTVHLTVLAAPPTLTGIQPSRIDIGADDTNIVLRGSGFNNSTSLFLDGVQWTASPIKIVDSSTLQFTMPRPFLSGEYNFAITVQNSDSAVSTAIPLPIGRPAPAIGDGGVVSAASYSGQAISPGELITIFGSNFEPGMQVIFDGIPAEPFYLSPNQLSVTVPYGIAGAREVAVVVQQSFERRSAPERVVVWPARPGLFTANSSGKGQGAILNQDGSMNSAANPAARGSVIVLYATGGGPLHGNLLELPVKVFIDGMESEVLYAGVAPGLVPGAVQVNVRVPEFAVNGEVVLRVGERESQSGVTFALR